MKITLEDKEYELNVERAKELNLLKESPHFPLQVGDVYKAPRYSPMLLIKPFYNDGHYILVGSFGLKPFSNAVHQTLMSEQAVKECLTSINAQFSHNINSQVDHLIAHKI